MKERNEFLEADGLFWESETHEWFHDKSSTRWTQNEDVHGTKLPNIYAFVVRNKETGEYDRVLMNVKSNEIIYETKSLEQLGVHIDMMKASKRFKK